VGIFGEVSFEESFEGWGEGIIAEASQEDVEVLYNEEVLQVF
jgi:hypothetical protein